MSAFGSISTPPAVPTWALSGPRGADLDMLVAMAVHAGCSAEHTADGYRLTGPAEFLTAYAEQIRKIDGYGLGAEQAPRGALVVAKANVEPARPFRRSTLLSGPAYDYVARAIDLGLKVEAAGVLRWSVSGTTGAQMAWWATVRSVSTEQALAEWGLTVDDAVREDAELAIPTPRVHVNLEMPSTLTIDKMPERRSKQEVTRDRDGEIVEVVTIEKDAA